MFGLGKFIIEIGVVPSNEEPMDGYCEKSDAIITDSLSTMDNEVGVTTPESTTQTLPLFEEYKPPVTYPEEVEKTLGTPIEVEILNETKLEEVIEL
nr:ribonuclease H-like domain-containing protein [Tanacetum cinerariifolium]